MEGWLSLDAAELRRALDVMSRVVPRNQILCHAALWKDGRDAVLRIAGIESRIPAEGRWSGVVMTYAAFYLGEHERLPRDGTICLHLDRDRLSIGASSIRCWRRPSAGDWPRFIEQPWPFRIDELVDLAFTRDPAELEHSGISHTVRRLLRDERYWIDEAAAEPGDPDEDDEERKPGPDLVAALLRAALRRIEEQTALHFEGV